MAKHEERGAFAIERSDPGFSQVAHDTETRMRQATLGKSTQGEEGVLHVGQLLARAWSTHDAVWEAVNPRSGNTGPEGRFGEEVDVLLRCVERERAHEAVQVTRVGPEEYRRALGKTGAAEGEYSCDPVVGLMLDRAKAKGRRLDPRDPILALDATQFSAALLLPFDSSHIHGWRNVLTGMEIGEVPKMAVYEGRNRPRFG